MKIILWATLTANGNYARSDKTHPPFPAALADFGQHIQQTGCFIVGRTTFEGFRASGARVDPAMQVVVISSQALDIPGVAVASSPQQAIEILATKGHKTAVLAGGAQLHNSFLREGLVDEIVFNVAPALEDKGYNILLNEGQYKRLTLLETKQLDGDIVQLHYSLQK